MKLLCDQCHNPLHDGYMVRDNKRFCGYICQLDNAKKDGYLSWNTIEGQMQRNTNPRVSWRSILGCSLSKAIYRYKASGHTKEQTMIGLSSFISEKLGYLPAEYKRRLEIGIPARWGESGSYDKEMKRDTPTPSFPMETKDKEKRDMCLKQFIDKDSN